MRRQASSAPCATSAVMTMVAQCLGVSGTGAGAAGGAAGCACAPYANPASAAAITMFFMFFSWGWDFRPMLCGPRHLTNNPTLMTLTTYVGGESLRVGVLHWPEH